MKLACPSCHHFVEVSDLDAELSAQVSCPECGAVVGITVTISILSAGEARQAAPSVGRVVVAMTDRELRTAYAEALAKAGYAVTEASETRQTLQMLGRAVPDVAVVDGGFPAIFGMGVGEIIKKSNVTRNTRVLGLRTDAASPLPVPGADRTVAVTVGIDTIVREVIGLAAAGGGPAPADAAKAAAEADLAEAPRPAGEVAPPPPSRRRLEDTPSPPPPRAEQPPAPGPPASPEPPAVPPPPAAHAPAPPPPAAVAPSAASPDGAADPEHAAAQRLARIIVSDTALYNQVAVEEGIRNGRLRETLVPLLEEGRHHYEDRTPPHVREATDYLGAALEQFVARKMKAMRPAAV